MLSQFIRNRQPAERTSARPTASVTLYTGIAWGVEVGGLDGLRGRQPYPFWYTLCQRMFMNEGVQGMLSEGGRFPGRDFPGTIGVSFTFG